MCGNIIHKKLSNSLSSVSKENFSFLLQLKIYLESFREDEFVCVLYALAIIKSIERGLWRMSTLFQLLLFPALGNVLRFSCAEKWGWKTFFLHKKPFQTSTGPDWSSSLNLNVNLLSLAQLHAQALFNNKPVLADCPDFKLNYWWILITSVVAALFHRNRLFQIYYKQTSPHLTLTCFQQGFLSTYISQTLLPITIFTMRGCNTKQICFPSFSWY